MDSLFDIKDKCIPRRYLINETLSAIGDNAGLDALQDRYSSPLLQPLLPLLACPIENALSAFIADKDFDFRFDDFPTSDEVFLFEKIVLYVDR